MLICLPLDGIVIELEKNEEGQMGGSITSSSKFPDPDTANKLEFNRMADAILAMVLAHAVEGIDVESRAYVRGIETALEKSAQVAGL